MSSIGAKLDDQFTVVTLMYHNGQYVVSFVGTLKEEIKD